MANPTTPRPKNPLSAYNLFFQYERKRILSDTDHEEIRITPEIVQAISLEHKNKGKRLHRKTHGKISFRDLARKIGAAWRRVDQESRKVLEEQARFEKYQHNVAMKAWRSRMELEAQSNFGHQEVARQQREEVASQEILMNSMSIRRQFIGNQPNALELLQQLRDRIEAEMLRFAGGAQLPELFHDQSPPQHTHEPLQLQKEVFHFEHIMHEEAEEKKNNADDFSSLDEWAQTASGPLKEIISCNTLDQLFNDN